MGLTSKSTGKMAFDCGLNIKRCSESEYIVALAGNPNVGKSTLFNSLTGMKQHTGNWPGKTVANAQGKCRSGKNSYILVDIPGTYSLMAHSKEEEVARNFICFGNADAVVVVCDATCLERNLNLVLQVAEIMPRVIVCVNLCDEAKRKNICIDTKELSKRLGLTVVKTVARDKKSLKNLLDSLDMTVSKEKSEAYVIKYPDIIENAVLMIENEVLKVTGDKTKSRFISLNLLDSDESLINEINRYYKTDITDNESLAAARKKALGYLNENNITDEMLKDMVVGAIVEKSNEICSHCVKKENSGYGGIDKRLDRLFTSRQTGFPIMLLFMLLIFWLTIVGANYPSDLLAAFFGYIQGKLYTVFEYFNAPAWFSGVVIDGAYRVLTWVVSVMLPPMAIFFPLFTLLEDMGYLPRIAYNLDKPFRCCSACGKQALTMCMGFGCNAAGVVGARIIDSPRERLLAVLTNNFVPCNGRFPTLIVIISMFFVTGSGIGSSVLSALMLTLLIIIGVGASFGATKLLSSTVLRGTASSFTFELPPYRKPQIGKVIIRSVFDRTLFVLGRAAAVAAPAGVILWLLANISADGVSLLSYTARFIDPFARLMGLDGAILIAFILGFPANEIVLPIIVMVYTASGTISDLTSVSSMHELLVSNGWTWVTAINVILFSLMHWPCSTTLLTIKKETGSFGWTLLSAVLPTVFGIVVCICVNAVGQLFV